MAHRTLVGVQMGWSSMGLRRTPAQVPSSVSARAVAIRRCLLMDMPAMRTALSLTLDRAHGSFEFDAPVAPASPAIRSQPSDYHRPYLACTQDSCMHATTIIVQHLSTDQVLPAPPIGQCKFYKDRIFYSL